jgi:uncharacterized membrane protein
MFILIAGLILFLGVHSMRIAAPDWRNAQMKALGEGKWKGAYSLIAAAGLFLIIWGYARAAATAPVFYEPPIWLKHTAAFLMVFAFVAIMVYAFPAGRLKPALKHPMLVSVKIWAVAHLLANGDLASILLFGGFLVWAVADRISVKRRGDAVPAAGPVRNDVMAIAAAAVLYLLFIWRLHVWLFGAVPLPVA